MQAGLWILIRIHVSLLDPHSVWGSGYRREKCKNNRKKFKEIGNSCNFCNLLWKNEVNLNQLQVLLLSNHFYLTSFFLSFFTNLGTGHFCILVIRKNLSQVKKIFSFHNKLFRPVISYKIAHQKYWKFSISFKKKALLLTMLQ